ncbi:hypothetical protein Hanom_Chr01g00065821 [Helianthus anomalus]
MRSKVAFGIYVSSPSTCPKLRKPPPVYQTQNEGSDHNPRFRSTALVDGVNYTSSNTFQLRKMTELDVSRIAYTAVTQKDKTEALQFIKQV